MDEDESYRIAICHLNNVWHDIESIHANDLVIEFTRQYNDSKMLYTMKYGKAEQAKENLRLCKIMLRALADDGYFKMGEDLECYPTQKLFNADEFPIGFKTRMIQ